MGTLFLVLHKGLRKATLDLLCCNFRSPTPAVPVNANSNLEIAPPHLVTDPRGGNGTQMPHNSRTYMLSETRSEAGSKNEKLFRRDVPFLCMRRKEAKLSKKNYVIMTCV